MLTSDEQAELDSIRAEFPDHFGAPPEQPSIMSRIGQQAANFLPNVGQGLTNSLIGLQNITQPSNNPIPPVTFPKPYDIAPPQTFGQSAVDIGAGLGQVVAEAAIPGGVATRAGRLLGLGRYAPILGDAIAGGLQGIKQSNGEALGTGAEFGALGAANLIPNRGIRLLANAAVPVAGQLLRGQSPLDQQSLINTGANISVPALLGAYGRHLETPEIATRTPEEAQSPSQPPSPVSAQQPDLFAGPTEGPQASILSPREEPTRSAFLTPASQYVAGATGGALAGPLIDQEDDKPVWEKMLEGAAIGAGAVGLGRGAGAILLHRAPEPIPTTIEELASMRQDRFKGATIRVLDNESQLPDDWKAKIQPALDSGARHEGLVNPATGETYIFKDNLTDPTRASQVIAHEVAGHYGVEQLLSRSDWRSAQESVLNGDSQRAKDISQAYFGNDDLSSLNPRQRETVTKEYIARLSENTPLNPNLWERLKDGVNRATRALGAKRDWSDSEFQGLIRRGAKEAETPLLQPSGVRPDIFPAGSQTNQSEVVNRVAVKGASGRIYTGPIHATIEDAMPEASAQHGYLTNKGRFVSREEANTLPRAKMAIPMRGDATGEEIQDPFRRESYIEREISSAPDEEKPHLQKQLSDTREEIKGMGYFWDGNKYSRTQDLNASIVDTAKSLFPTRKAGDEQDTKPTIGGYINKTFRREFGVDRSAPVFRADELAKGEKNKQLIAAMQTAPILGTATAAERKPLLDFQNSARTPSDVALLKAAVRPEIADAYLKSEGQIADMQHLEFQATDDPIKQRILSETQGIHRTQQYLFFSDFPRWLKENAANPNRKADLITELKATNQFPGMDDNALSSQIDTYQAEKMRGEPDFEYGAGSSKLSKDLWIHRQDLGPAFEKWLGKIEDPVQRIQATQMKFINDSAQARKIVELTEAGKRGELDVKTWKERMDERNAAAAAGDIKRVAQLDALKQIPKNSSFGTLSGKLVPQDVIDSLNAHNQLWGGGVLRTLAPLNHLIKTSLTVNNPGTHARQWIQTPILAAVVRVAPWDFFPAVRAIREKGADWDKLVRNHIVGADFSSSELARVGKELDLAYNPGKGGKVMEALRKTQSAIQKAYGLPDNLVRAAAYLKHEPRFFAEGNKLGIRGDDLQRYTESKTTAFVNRYTMNYGAVPNITKVGRETPFVSPFLSYQSEMVRILKNLGEDAIKGSPGDRTWALGNLASLTALPLIAMQAGKAQLSDKDREDWDRANRLSPAYSGGQLRIPLGRNKDGSFKYINVANLMPAGDTSALLRNLAGGDGAKLFASNPFIGWEKTPILNLAAEQISGRDSVTDQLLTPAGRVKEVAKAFLPPLTPGIGYEADRAVSSFTQNNEGGRGLMNPRTGRMDTPGTFLLRNVVGVPVSQVQPRALLQRAKSDEQEVERGIKSEMNQTTGTNASPEAKQKAREVALLKIGNARAKYNATKDGTTIQIAKSKIAKAQSLGWSVEQ